MTMNLLNNSHQYGELITSSIDRMIDGLVALLLA